MILTNILLVFIALELSVIFNEIKKDKGEKKEDE